MKRAYYSILILSFILFGIQQSIAQRNHLSFKINGFKGVSLNYERAWTPYLSSSVAYLDKTYSYRITGDYTNQVKGINLEGRLYLNRSLATMRGFYLGPNLSFKRNKLDYRYDPNQDNSILSGVGFLVTLITLGQIDLLDKGEPKSIIEGNQTLNSTSLGLKLGYQVRRGAFSMDTGINLKNNRISKSKSNGISANVGGNIPYQKDITGNTTTFYLGFGYIF